MPDLHLDMFNEFSRRPLAKRLFDAIRSAFQPDIYGLEWGDPDSFEPLKFIRDTYLLPYVDSTHNAIEIGPGGGRWTRYMLRFRKLYVIDHYPELLDELKKVYNDRNIVPVLNTGSDFPGIEPVEFIFSFGTFVHLDLDVIDAYLRNMKGILKPDGNAVIQYADKTKIIAQRYESFSDNTPEKMRTMLKRHGWSIVEEDTTTLWHSSVVRFTH